jgi:uncharacterized membrane protein
MNKMIVVVFENESSAYEGLNALKDLHMEGSITLYSTAVLNKDDSGEVQIKQAADKGLVGTAIGMATGSLIGVLAGPVGLFVGASLGGLTGVMVDINEAGVDAGFVEDVSNALSPGKYAVLAEIDEMWLTPVDTRMSALDGLVFRRLRSEVEDDQLIRESEAFDKELQELENELAEANEETKAAISVQIDNTKKKLQAINQRTKDKLDKTTAEGKAKVDALKQQMADAKENRKAKMEKRKTELEAEYAERSAKLEQSWQLTKEALS